MTLVSEILSEITLMQNNECCWVSAFTVWCSFCRHSEPGKFSSLLITGNENSPQRNICHRINDDSSMSWCSVSHSCDSGLENVVSIEELLFSIRLQPDFEFGIRSKIIECSDLEMKLLRFGELSETCSEREEWLAWDTRSLTHQIFWTVVHSFLKMVVWLVLKASWMLNNLLNFTSLFLLILNSLCDFWSNSLHHFCRWALIHYLQWMRLA